MGFPEWTLIGMGLSAVGALLALILAYIGQSPQFLNRSGLKRARLDLRVRALTSYAIALLILAIGFFLAGVPLDSQPESNSMESQSPEDGTAVSDESSSSFDDVAVSSTSPTVASTPATPETGAFAGPPEPTETSEEASIDTAEVITSTVANSTLAPDFPTAPDEASATPSATPSPTPTATPTPTQTPSPTLTPTPISGETAVVDSGGNMVWLRRSPGGQDLVLVNDNEILLLLPGHANQGGQLWQEVSTLEGVAGWILEDLLELPEE